MTSVSDIFTFCPWPIKIVLKKANDKKTNFNPENFSDIEKENRNKTSKFNFE